jgi:uncharacterized protein YuzE
VKITYDPIADAAYVQLAVPRADDGQTTVNDNGLIVDWDARGRPRGFEFLSVRESGLPLDGLPESVKHAIEDFIASGALDAKQFVEREYS